MLTCSKNMNILILSSFPISKYRGGVQTASIILAKAFKKMGHKVVFFSLELSDQATVEGIEHYCLSDDFAGKLLEHHTADFSELKARLAIDIVINQTGFNLLTNKLLRDAKSTERIYTVHHNCLKCLIKQYHNIYSTTLSAKPYGKLLDNPLGWSLLKLVAKKRMRTRIIDTLASSDGLVLLSPTYIEELSYFNIPANTSTVFSIPNALPFEVNSQGQKKDKRVLFVGRLDVIQKRVDRLFAIWKNLSEVFQDWHFDIIGDGDERKNLEQKFQDANVQRVYFHGFCDPRPFLEKGSLLLMVSDFEGLPMVLLEACAYGVVPVVYNSFSSASMILDKGKNGLLIPAFDESLFLKKTSKLISDDKEREKLSSSGIEYMANFSPLCIAKEWEKVWQT